ncbi:small conductance mechanosensitive channel [Devosia lucknowensis]|uniref:Small-conductance mechanosensitive channel n=1 Tax=Devosia lucknowensis TaxID=1096929 RepID=A0A1Y6EVT1_9HYPH|nr:mechanosensitive ion channel domain-containing protein [Devosia lucknowensis]SMQ65341.1 small conductance mechanosensitive channel [Devosia lucknowensis]
MTDDTFFGVSTAWILTNAWSLLVAIIVLVAGWIIANIVSRALASFVAARVRNSATVAPLIGQVVRYAVLFVTIIIVLGQFGVETASILAVLGAAGLAIALALQGTLSNIAAGIMLVFLRPFNTGDYIDADGIVGTVVEVGLFATQMRTIDGVFLFAPNSKLSNAKIINYSREADRMVEVKFNVPRSADLATVRAQLVGSMRTDYSDPNAQSEVLLDTLGDSNMTLVARVPVRSKDWWRARSEVQERVKQVLDANNNFAPAA